MSLLLSNLMLSVFLWLLLIELLQFLDPAKGDPVNDRVIHAHHQRRRNDEFTVLVIDLVHRFRNCVGFGGEQLQLLAVMGDEVIHADCLK
jgi:hypothetical protein